MSRVLLILAVFVSLTAMVRAQAKDPGTEPLLKSINRGLSCRAKNEVQEWFELGTIHLDNKTMTGLAPVHRKYRFSADKDSKGYLVVEEPKLKYVPLGDFDLFIHGRKLHLLSLVFNGSRITFNKIAPGNTKDLQIIRRNGVVTAWLGGRSAKLAEWKDDDPMEIIFSSDEEWPYAHANLTKIGFKGKISK